MDLDKIFWKSGVWHKENHIQNEDKTFSLFTNVNIFESNKVAVSAQTEHVHDLSHP